METEVVTNINKKGHSSFKYKHNMYIVGGIYKSNKKYYNDEFILKYNYFNEKWSNVLTTGECPYSKFNKCVINNNELYVFGGIDEDSPEPWNYNEIDEFDMNYVYKLYFDDFIDIYSNNFVDIFFELS
jgi:N-acetylneuraminic acid mutarotase